MIDQERMEPLPIVQDFVKTRWGWYVSTTQGMFILECGFHAITRKGAERKAARLARKLRRVDLAQINRERVTR